MREDDGGGDRRELVMRGVIVLAWLAISADHLRRGDTRHAVFAALLAFAWALLELRTQARRRRRDTDGPAA